MQKALITLSAGSEIAARLADDPRADGGRRMIFLGPRYVTIKRRMQGVKMHLRVPVQNYMGVVLSREERRDGAFFSVRLSHRDPELCVTLREARDQGDSIDAWRHWAAFFAMPALVECGAGRWEVLTSSPRAAKGSVPPLSCTHPVPLSKRRARGLLRKRGCADRRATVFRGEREIIAYE
jgi:Family of unknown function (DUF6101)